VPDDAARVSITAGVLRLPTTYPIELKLKGRLVVVVGGGPVAARKAAGLLEAEADVLVISPEFCPELERLPGCRLEQRAYTSSVLDTAELAFACTDSPAVNAQVAADARARGVPCNVADDPDLCDFFVPATLRRGELTIAVGTGGAGPHLAANLRDLLASQIGEPHGILVEELGRLRSEVFDRVHDAAARREVRRKLSSNESLDLLARGGRDRWRTWAGQLIAEVAAR
jgi:precorrin-2 dehydrogenase / sirohydrochlorin ferrochelatase